MLTPLSEGNVKRMIVCGTLMTIVALLAACQPPTFLKSDDLVGIWTTDYGSVTEYREDGTFRTADTIERLETEVFTKGQYQLQGTRLTLQNAKDSVTCPGAEGSYQIQITKDGELIYELEADECVKRRAKLSNEGPQYRVSP